MKYPIDLDAYECACGCGILILDSAANVVDGPGGRYIEGHDPEETEEDDG